MKERRDLSEKKFEIRNEDRRPTARNNKPYSSKNSLEPIKKENIPEIGKTDKENINLEEKSGSKKPNLFGKANGPFKLNKLPEKKKDLTINESEDKNEELRIENDQNGIFVLNLSRRT